MISTTTFVVFNAICLVLFFQSLWISLVQIIRRQALLPPTAPTNDLANIPSPVPLSAHYNETQQAILRAIHPHLHDSPSRPQTTAGKPRLTTSCSSTTVGGSCTTKLLYNTTVPYLSTFLLFLQALLGVTTTLMAIFAAPSTVDCTRVAQFTLIAWHIGMAFIFLGAAVQTHLVNDRCIKIFFIVALGVAANSVFIALVLGKRSFSGTGVQDICVVDVQQPDGWLGNLPTYLGVSNFLMSFFSGISYINASTRLSTRARFLSFKETSFVMAVYRGIGMLFACFLLGTLSNAAIITMSSLRQFHYSPWWIVQWAVMSRVFGAGLWHRGNTDTVAHVHPFWTSEKYLVWHPRLQVEDGNTWKPRVSSVVARYAGSVMDIVCTRAFDTAVNRSEVPNEIKGVGPSNGSTLRRASRHDTVVEDTFHCTSCTCGIF